MVKPVASFAPTACCNLNLLIQTWTSDDLTSKLLLNFFSCYIHIMSVDITEISRARTRGDLVGGGVRLGFRRAGNVMSCVIRVEGTVISSSQLTNLKHGINHYRRSADTAAPAASAVVSRALLRLITMGYGILYWRVLIITLSA